MKIGDLVIFEYTKLSGLHSPNGLVLKRLYDHAEHDWPGEWRCLVQFSDGEKVWIPQKELVVISSAKAVNEIG